MLPKELNTRIMSECPICSCFVRENNLQKHLNKAHKKDKLTRSNLNAETIKKTLALVIAWSRGAHQYDVPKEYLKPLTFMALTELMGYKSKEVIEVDSPYLGKDTRMIEDSRIQDIYTEMKSDLKDFLKPLGAFSKTLMPRKKNQNQSQSQRPKARLNTRGKDALPQSNQNSSWKRAGDDSYVGSWNDCNTIDRSDGSKYLGYLRREYESSRFGSYPIHDDYSEESWADDNPWE